MNLVQLCRGGYSYDGRATLQRGGGTVVISKAFFADNSADPGNYTVNAFADFLAVVTAMDGGVPDTAYAGTVTLSCTAKPPGAANPSFFKNTFVSNTIDVWVNGVSTDLLAWVFEDPGAYTIQMTDGTTTSTVVITCL